MRKEKAARLSSRDPGSRFGNLRPLAHTGESSSPKRDYRSTLCRDEQGKFYSVTETFSRFSPQAKVREKVRRVGKAEATTILGAIAAMIDQDRKGGK